MKPIERKNVWLSFITLGPLTAYGAIYDRSLILLAVIFIIIGIKGIRYDML